MVTFLLSKTPSHIIGINVILSIISKFTVLQDILGPSIQPWDLMRNQCQFLGGSTSYMKSENVPWNRSPFQACLGGIPF